MEKEQEKLEVGVDLKTYNDVNLTINNYSDENNLSPGDNLLLLYYELIKDVEINLSEQVKTNPPKSKIHCKKGCYYCCYMRVTVTAFEALAIYQYIDNEFTDDKKNEIKNGLKGKKGVSNNLSDKEYLEELTPCPLLKDGQCSIYPVRPLECHGFTSKDVEACKDLLKDYDNWHIPIYFPQYSIYKHAQAALIKTLKINELPNNLLEFTAALDILLNEPDVIGRLKSGEDIFKVARIPQSDPEVVAFKPWTDTSII